MPGRRRGIYQRGDFWLDHERGRDGRPKNAKLYICWYDTRARRNRRRSTRTEDVELAKDRLDEHYLAHSRPPQVDPAAYALGDAITDYWIEHGQRQTAFDSIRARLNLVVRFLAAEIETGRMEEPVCVDAITDDFLARFEACALTDPITWKNRKGRVILTKQRSEATVNEAVRQLRAAVRHAWKRRRIASVPHIPVAKRGDVSAPTLERISVAQIAEMLDYAVASRRRQSLHRYLIAAVTTLARPEAICDMNVDPARQQWDVDGRRFNLNPTGPEADREVPADRAGGRDHGGLRVAVTVLLAEA